MDRSKSCVQLCTNNKRKCTIQDLTTTFCLHNVKRKTIIFKYNFPPRPDLIRFGNFRFSICFCKSDLHEPRFKAFTTLTAVGRMKHIAPLLRYLSPFPIVTYVFIRFYDFMIITEPHFLLLLLIIKRREVFLTSQLFYVFV